MEHWLAGINEEGKYDVYKTWTDDEQAQCFKVHKEYDNDQNARCTSADRTQPGHRRKGSRGTRRNSREPFSVSLTWHALCSTRDQERNKGATMKRQKLYIVHAAGQDFEFTSKPAARHFANEKHGDPTLYRTVERTREPKWNELQQTPKPEKSWKLYVDSWSRGQYHPAAILEESDWDAAQFFVTTPHTENRVAVRLEVTGKTFQFPFGQGSPKCVRVRVEFVGDGEESTYAKGWVALPESWVR